MMIFSLVAMIGLDKCCITSACLQWLCHSGERIVARGPLVPAYKSLLTIANSFLLNIAEHENFSANKYENANYCWHFHIY